MFCFSRLTEDNEYALNFLYEFYGHWQNLCSDRSQINIVWFHVAFTYTCQAPLALLLLETSQNPVPSAVSTLEFQESCRDVDLGNGTSWEGKVHRMEVPECCRAVLVGEVSSPKLEQKNWIIVQASKLCWEPTMCKLELSLQMSASQYSVSPSLKHWDYTGL